MGSLASRRRRLPLAYLFSAVLVLSNHLALSTIPHFLLDYSLPPVAMLPVAAVVMVTMTGLGRALKRIAGFRASAPATVVFNVVFVWGVYVMVVRPAISPMLDALFHVQCGLLMIGFYSILTGDPGFVAAGCSHLEVGFLSTRVRHCSRCKANIKGFDHHCPAFGNCIGQKNHLLFLILLIGFVLAEASYTIYAFQFTTVFDVDNAWLKKNPSGNLVVGTVLFSLLQMLWQVVFLIWHFYCICCNIKTDEWINWKKYPEFQLITQEQSGERPELRFWNPYDKGIIGNIKDFLNSRLHG